MKMQKKREKVRGEGGCVQRMEVIVKRKKSQGEKIFSIGQGQLTPQSMVGPNSDVNQGSLLCCKFAKK